MSDIRHYILDRVSGGVSQDEIVWYVCEQTGLHWDDAQALVLDTIQANATEVYRRRLPVLLAICLVTQVSGLATIGAAVWPLVEFWSLMQGAPSQMQDLLGVGLVAINIPGLFWQALFGTALLAGGIVGLWRVLRMEDWLAN